MMKSRQFWIPAVMILVIGILIGTFLVHRKMTTQQSTDQLNDASSQPQEVPPPVASNQQELVFIMDEGYTDMPVPEDVEAIARFFAPEGNPRIEDAAVVWQKQDNKYVRTLEKESLQDSAYMMYRMTELIQVMGNEAIIDPGNNRIIALMARTRRYNKLLAHIREAKAEGASAEVVSTLSQTVQSFLAERKKIFAKIARLAEEHPEVFNPESNVSDELRHELVDLTRGHAHSMPGAPAGAIPLSLDGTKLAITANVFLLGYTEHPDAIGPILSIARYGKEEKGDWEVYKQATGSVYPRFYDSLGPQNWFVIGDALDRIIVALAKNEGLRPESQAVANEYLQWRSDQNWQTRKKISTYAFNDPSINPYSFRGEVIRVVSTKQPMQEAELDSCLSFGKDQFDIACPNEVTQIIRWAERLEETL